MRIAAWLGCALSAGLVVAGVIAAGVDKQAQESSLVASATPPSTVPSNPQLRTPVWSPWAPGTAINVTKTLPVPGETIQVGQCTIAYSLSVGEQAYAVTASHCGQVGDYVWASSGDTQADFSAPIGTFSYSDLYLAQGHQLDLGLIEITDPHRVMPAAQPPVESTVLIEPWPLEQPLCKFGMTTGTTCGNPTQATGREVLIDKSGQQLPARANTADVCARPGDSGGPVYTTLAGRQVIVGLVSGTREGEDAPDCTDPSRAMTMSYTSMADIQPVIDEVLPAAAYLSTSE